MSGGHPYGGLFSGAVVARGSTVDGCLDAVSVECLTIAHGTEVGYVDGLVLLLIWCRDKYVVEKQSYTVQYGASTAAVEGDADCMGGASGSLQNAFISYCGGGSKTYPLPLFQGFDREVFHPLTKGDVFLNHDAVEGDVAVEMERDVGLSAGVGGGPIGVETGVGKVFGTESVAPGMRCLDFSLLSKVVAKDAVQRGAEFH